MAKKKLLPSKSAQMLETNTIEKMQTFISRIWNRSDANLQIYQEHHGSHDDRQHITDSMAHVLKQNFGLNAQSNVEALLVLAFYTALFFFLRDIFQKLLPHFIQFVVVVYYNSSEKCKHFVGWALSGTLVALVLVGLLMVSEAYTKCVSTLYDDVRLVFRALYSDVRNLLTIIHLDIQFCFKELYTDTKAFLSVFIDQYCMPWIRACSFEQVLFLAALFIHGSAMFRASVEVGREFRALMQDFSNVLKLGWQGIWPHMTIFNIVKLVTVFTTAAVVVYVIPDFDWKWRSATPLLPFNTTFQGH